MSSGSTRWLRTAAAKSAPGRGGPPPGRPGHVVRVGLHEVERADQEDDVEGPHAQHGCHVQGPQQAAPFEAATLREWAAVQDAAGECVMRIRGALW